MSAVAHDHDHHNPMEPTRSEQVKMNRLGLWVFCLSESFLFFALLGTRFYLWRNPVDGIIRPDLAQIPAFIFTGVLLASSYFMNRAEVAISKDDRTTFNYSMLLTAALGLVFLFGVVLVEWGLATGPELLLGDGAFGAVFYAMTGMHALHVIMGIALILIVWNNGRKGLYTAEDHWAVEACAIFWHYVDLVWVFFYPALYLIGTAIELHH
ncbi:MAG: cytochrome c oxidase subunit 3 [Ardenticatenaceae bacterium]|nr:cytochrome c oxidase subunit 3 [Ardenticatenaceae bacterium]